MPKILWRSECRQAVTAKLTHQESNKEYVRLDLRTSEGPPNPRRQDERNDTSSQQYPVSPLRRSMRLGRLDARAGVAPL